MSRIRTKSTERILAALLSILMVFTMIPMSTLTAFAAGVPGVISTDIESKTFTVGTTTNFTYTTTANDDAGKYVKGSFAIKDTDTGLSVNIADVAKLEYQEYPSGVWYEFYGDFGPETGFPMTDATSNFRATFTQKGNYTVDVAMKAVEDNSSVCAVSSNIVVNGQPSVLTTDIGEKTFNVGDPTEFDFGIIANDDAGKYIFGSFEIKNKDTGDTVNIADIAKLEYKESGTGIWYEFYGDFGPAGTGFPMTDATSHFRVTFRTKGNYTVIVKAKSATDSTIYSQVSNDIVVEHNAEEIAEIIANKGEFTFDVSGESTSAHKVKVVCTDAAGNEQVEEITDFYVTTNLWVRYYTNKPLFFGSIGGVILIAGLAVALIVIKKKKKQA